MVSIRFPVGECLIYCKETNDYLFLVPGRFKGYIYRFEYFLSFVLYFFVAVKCFNNTQLETFLTISFFAVGKSQVSKQLKMLQKSVKVAEIHQNLIN